jgi:hypothetical protein
VRLYVSQSQFRSALSAHGDRTAVSNALSLAANVVQHAEMTPDTSYISTFDSSKKEQVDNLLDRFETYVVGDGYIDIIVLRQHLESFIIELTAIDVAICNVSWWCNATDNNKKKFGCPHGMGGPETKHGWFSEIVQEEDDLQIDHKRESIAEINQRALKIIKSKTMDKPYDPALTFETTLCLTPGLWLQVPDNWKRGE